MAPQGAHTNHRLHSAPHGLLCRSRQYPRRSADSIPAHSWNSRGLGCVEPSAGAVFASRRMFRLFSYRHFPSNQEKIYQARYTMYICHYCLRSPPTALIFLRALMAPKSARLSSSASPSSSTTFSTSLGPSTSMYPCTFLGVRRRWKSGECGELACRTEARNLSKDICSVYTLCFRWSAYALASCITTGQFVSFYLDRSFIYCTCWQVSGTRLPRRYIVLCHRDGICGRRHPSTFFENPSSVFHPANIQLCPVMSPTFRVSTLPQTQSAEVRKRLCVLIVTSIPTPAVDLILIRIYSTRRKRCSWNHPQNSQRLCFEYFLPWGSRA